MALAGHDFTKKQLLVLAFDHRGSFMEKLFGIKGRPPTAEETKTISDFKRVVYEGFLRAIDKGVPKNIAGILVDEQFGDAILRDARTNGVTFAAPCEKSGQDEFDFDYGEKFGEHIEKYAPAYVKVLVRLNPEADAVANARQLQRLKRLNDYLSSKGRPFLFELLVPATAGQLAEAKGDKKFYDAHLRPVLMVRAMQQIQNYGVEPDVWKMEGVDAAQDASAIVRQAQSGGRKAGVITLGRGESKDKVKEWLAVGAKIQGIIGFAVGRTIFWDALEGLKSGKLDRAKAVEMIAQNYLEFARFWTKK